MSRRFGRNQRRRAREAIAAAEQRIDNMSAAMRQDQARLARQRSRIDEAEWFQREIAAMVGHRAIIAGQATSMDLGKLCFEEADRWRVIPYEPLGPVLGPDAPDTVAIRDETLRLLDIEFVRDEFSRRMHAWVKIAGAEVCYAMTESAFRGMTEPELMRHLVEPVARQLAIELKRRFR